MSNVDMRDAFFDEVYKIASEDKDVVFMTADADAFGLRKFKKDMPEQFINVGVAEQNLIDVAAGLAMNGKKVFVYSFISFITARCFEQIKVSICSHDLPVFIVGVGPGFSFGFDGPTHHGTIDIGLMNLLPGMTIYNPSSSYLAKQFCRDMHNFETPAYIRIDKGTFDSIHSEYCVSGMEMVKDENDEYVNNSDLCIISTGKMVHTAIEVANKLDKKGIKTSVLDICVLKPLNDGELREYIKDFDRVVTLEDNSIVGGLGSMVAEEAATMGGLILKRIASPDEQCFIYGDREYIEKHYRLDCDSVLKRILRWIK